MAATLPRSSLFVYVLAGTSLTDWRNREEEPALSPLAPRARATAPRRWVPWPRKAGAAVPTTFRRLKSPALSGHAFSPTEHGHPCVAAESIGRRRATSRHASDAMAPGAACRERAAWSSEAHRYSSLHSNRLPKAPRVPLLYSSGIREEVRVMALRLYL